MQSALLMCTLCAPSVHCSCDCVCVCVRSRWGPSSSLQSSLFGSSAVKLTSLCSSPRQVQHTHPYTSHKQCVAPATPQQVTISKEHELCSGGLLLRSGSFRDGDDGEDEEDERKHRAGDQTHIWAVLLLGFSSVQGLQE